MNRSLLPLLSIGIILSVSACSSYPLGMSEEEWNRLNPEQQLDARERQQRLDLAERQRQSALQLARAEQAAAEQALYQDALLNAGPGDQVQCVLQGGEGYYASNWRAAEAKGFSLLKGFTQDVSFPEQGRPSRSVTAQLTFDGANIKACRPHNRDCTNFAATQNQLRSGVTQPIHVNRTIRGHLYCDIPNLNRRRP